MKRLSEALFCFLHYNPFYLGSTEGQSSRSASSWFAPSLTAVLNCIENLYRTPLQHGTTHKVRLISPGTFSQQVKIFEWLELSSGEGRISFKSLGKRFKKCFPIWSLLLLGDSWIYSLKRRWEVGRWEGDGKEAKQAFPQITVDSILIPWGNFFFF